MNKYLQMGCFTLLFRFLIVLPIWYYLLYQILIRVDATELMMFLFWVYVPLDFMVMVFGSVIKVLIDVEDYDNN